LVKKLSHLAGGLFPLILEQKPSSGDNNVQAFWGVDGKNFPVKDDKERK
jgi:hypothetical protein